jgi:hypothetical protein
MGTKKRRGWDSNPRYPHEYNSLAGSPIRPLSHLSLSLPTSNEPAAQVIRTRPETVSLNSSSRSPIAEREGFEPPEPRGSTVFKTASFDHSDTSPLARLSIEVPIRLFRLYSQLLYLSINVAPEQIAGRISHTRRSRPSETHFLFLRGKEGLLCYSPPTMIE